jgi:hypothetical protein
LAHCGLALLRGVVLDLTLIRHTNVCNPGKPPKAPCCLSRCRWPGIRSVTVLRVRGGGLQARLLIECCRSDDCRLLQLRFVRARTMW